MKDDVKYFAPNVECAIITGATAAAIKTAFDIWKNTTPPFRPEKKKIVISCAMFGVTDLIVFYYVQS